MTNEEKVARLEEIAQYYPRMGDKDAALLREAAQLMRELSQLRPLGSSKQELFIVWWSEIKQRIAALTKQQPAACPRSEVRGVENNNA